MSSFFVNIETPMAQYLTEKEWLQGLVLASIQLWWGPHGGWHHNGSSVRMGKSSPGENWSQKEHKLTNVLPRTISFLLRAHCPRPDLVLYIAFFFIYMKGKERLWQRYLLSTGSLSQMFQHLGLGYVEARSWEIQARSPLWVTGIQPEPFPAACNRP